MSVFNQLPRIYQLAILQGARVEVQYKNRWMNILSMTGISYKTKYRVAERDLNIFEKAKEHASQIYTVVKYHEYDYMIPNNALSPGEIIVMEYGLGIYVQVQDDLTLRDLERKEAEKILEEKNQISYYSQSSDVFYGINPVED